MPMTDTTPYHARPAKEIEREADCMDTIFAFAKPVPFIFEAFGGVGRTATVLRKRFPGAGIRACDLDQKCCEVYNETHARSMAKCLHTDALEGLLKLNPRRQKWAASLDFNRFTLLDLGRKEGQWKRKLISEVVMRKPQWIQLTDSAVCYLQTNWWRYGIGERGNTPSETLSSYVARLEDELCRLYGLALKTYAHHNRATYLLFELNK